VATKLPALLLAICGLLAASCGPKKTAAPSTQPAGSKSATDAAAPKETAPNTREEPAEVDPLKRLELELAEAKKDNRRLRRRLEDQEAARASLEERYAGLEIELASSVEEVLRSKASLRSVHNRALAISRIAEVRVQLQSVPQAKDPEVAVRLERANDFLNRADKALVEENYGGSSYLSERAGELVRQAQMVAEVRTSSLGGADRIIPIVPARNLETVVKANLRQVPGKDKSIVGQVDKGKQILAIARWGDWFQVETGDGLRAWIHTSVVR
jgi:hypothetical protein